MTALDPKQKDSKIQKKKKNENSGAVWGTTEKKKEYKKIGNKSVKKRKKEASWRVFVSAIPLFQHEKMTLVPRGIEKKKTIGITGESGEMGGGKAQGESGKSYGELGHCAN